MKKKLIIDIGHPAQVHQFKYIYWNLINLGWVVLFSTKDKEITIDLLKQYNLPYKCLGKTKNGIFNKILNLPNVFFKFLRLVLVFKPTLICSRFSPHSCWVSKILGISHIGFADTEHTKLLDRITVPLVDLKVTPLAYQKNLKKNHIRFNGNIELFYLHPKTFVPNENCLKRLNIKPNEKFVILRFVSWSAHHDLGQGGFGNKGKIDLVSAISEYAKVFITSESPLPEVLQQYQINIPFHEIHDVLKFSTLYIGEGATMASEAAILGTPAIYVNSLTAGIIEEEKKMGLLYHFTSIDGVIDKAINILKNPNTKEEAHKKLERFLKDKIDVSQLITWLINGYPESKSEYLHNSEIQYQYK